MNNESLARGAPLIYVVEYFVTIIVLSRDASLILRVFFVAFETELYAFNITNAFAFTHNWNNFMVENDSIYVIRAYEANSSYIP